MLKKVPQQGRSSAVVESILQAATYILNERPRSEFTTNHVAADEGVGIGSLYQYFQNKENIAEALQQRHAICTQDSAYLIRLGVRVRAWRAENAMTRKALAEASGISERYIAQMESGKGNISILLLRKLSRAMGMSVETLVADEQRAPPSERIALIGLRGAGKSTLGQRLARLLRLPFVELDMEVEKEAGAKLGEVFALYGHDAYRRFERRALQRVLAVQSRAVIATGGSIVTDPQTYDLLLQHCVCLWLKASPEEHMSRVMAQGDVRPFEGHTAALQEIRKLLKDRDRLYSRADGVVETSGKSVKQSLQQMKRLLA